MSQRSLLLALFAPILACGSTTPSPLDAAIDPGLSDAAAPGDDAVDAGVSDAALVCADPLTACGEHCVDPLIDSEHCGRCDNLCADGTACFASTCTTAAAMPLRVLPGGAALGPDGQIYVFGGIDDQGHVVSAVQSFDPRTNRWSDRAPMLQPRAMFAGARVGDRFLAAGGVNARGSVVDLMHVYDFAADRWTKSTSMAQGRGALAGAADAEGRFYAVGGATDFAYSAALETFVPDRGEWLSLSSMSIARYNLAAETDSSGRIYAIGGGNSPSLPAGLSTVERYDPSEGHWSSLAPMLVGRFEPGAVRGPDGRLFVLGGHAPEGDTLRSAEAYDPLADRWALIPDMPRYRAGLLAVTGADGRIYAIGGHGWTVYEVHNSVDVYDPKLDRWSR